MQELFLCSHCEGVIGQALNKARAVSAFASAAPVATSSRCKVSPSTSPRAAASERQEVVESLAGEPPEAKSEIDRRSRPLSERRPSAIRELEAVALDSTF